MKWKLYLNLIALAGIAALVYVSRDAFVSAWEIALRINWLFMVVGIFVVRGLGFIAAGRYYQSFLSLFGHKIKLWFGVEAVLGANFVSQVFPSGGIFAVSWLALKLSGHKVPVATTVLATLSRYILTGFSYLVLLILTGLTLAVIGELTYSIAILISLLITVIVSSTVLIIFVTRNRSRIHKYAVVIVRVINATASVVFFFSKATRRLNIATIEDALNKFHDESGQVTKHRKGLQRPFFDLVLFNIAEVALIYIVFLAFGELVNPAVIVIAYGMATMVGSFVAITPSSIGIYETVMVFTFAALGLSNDLSLSATLVYRVAHLLLFLPIGFYFYQKIKLSSNHG